MSEHPRLRDVLPRWLGRLGGVVCAACVVCVLLAEASRAAPVPSSPTKPPACEPRVPAGTPPARIHRPPGGHFFVEKGHCAFMTPDGKAAAFALDEGLRWFGTREAPTMDLACLEAESACDGERRARAWDEAERLELVECTEAAAWAGWQPNSDFPPEPGRVLTVVGATKVVPFALRGSSGLWDARLSVRSERGWRHVRTLPVPEGGDPGRPFESFPRIYQHPDGGPLFVPIERHSGRALGCFGHDDPPIDYNYRRVEVFGVDEATWCPGAAGGAADAPTSNGTGVRGIVSSSVQPSVGGYTFAATNLIDGDLTTSWQPTDTRGWFEVTFDTPRQVAGIALVNGFAHSDATYGDLFPLNARVKTATLKFSDGRTQKITVATDTRAWQTITFPPRETSLIRLSIDTLAAGSRWPRDVAISEFRPL